ncbi:DUF502 domain-containing protein [Candidatus Sumerlaeota bacterium]|nr:DUF502 domain-containing protein [Candidatus Sumerlaeota bacterium]
MTENSINSTNPQEPKKQEQSGLWQRTRNDLQRRFIAGIITIIPITITLLILFFIVKKIYQVFSPLVSRLFYINVPILNEVLPVLISVLLLVILIYLIGLLSATYAIRRLIGIGESILARIPFIKILYSTSKQIVDAISLPQKGAFKKLVAIEYPRKGMYGLAFSTGEMIDESTGELLVSVFLPTTPNPTSGFLLLLPVEQVYEINLSIDAGVKLIISGGIVSPERIKMSPYKSLLKENANLRQNGEKNEQKSV